MQRFSILLFFVFLLSALGCDKKDACLDSGGCWDSVDNVCRKDEPDAQKLCNRTSKNFSVQPYLDDFEALKVHISKSYANLIPLLKYNKLDPYELNQSTIKAIKATTSESEAKVALIAFAKKFKDGHFKLRELKGDDKQSDETVKPIAKTLAGKQACEAMNFSWKKKFGFKFPVEGVKVLKQGDGEFPYLVTQDNTKKVGIIRVADFRPSVYPDLCVKAWEEYKKEMKTQCDKDCQDDFKYVFLRKRIVDKFYQSLEAVRKENISSLVVDLTSNGGGSDWVEDITALLTEKRLICGRGGFVKHPHHVKNFKELLADYKDNKPKEKVKIANMEANIKIASEPCNRTLIWTKKGHQLKCSLVAYPKGEKCKYNGELKYPGKKKYNGELFLLTNSGTASAAEDIVARHLDSKTATIIGGRTYGAGCGYMNGGIRFQLPNSGLDVRVPDCVREMADGTNEVVGIEPNIKMDMKKLKETGFLKDLISRVVK